MQGLVFDANSIPHFRRKPVILRTPKRLFYVTSGLSNPSVGWHKFIRLHDPHTRELWLGLL